MSDRFAEISFPLPVDRTFSYRLPPALADRAAPGARVLVPFGRRTMIGFVIGLSGRSPVARTRDVLALLDEESLLDPQLLDLCRWIAERYLAPLGLVLKTALPAGLMRRGRGRVRVKRVKRVLAVPGADASAGLDRAPRQRACLDLLRRRPEGISLRDLHREHGFGPEIARALRQKGLARVVDAEAARIAPVPPGDPFGEGWEGMVPGEAQARVLREVEGALSGAGHRVFLLHGVSGSGKTVVYIEAIRRALEAGRSALLLVPEIVLTPQTVSRIARAIDHPVALFHSALSAGERYDTWRKVRGGEFRVVVGARSAVFSPLRDLGLIVIDEEHETSYKQEESPRYHAREVAVERARGAGAVVILGSATPALETYWRARERDWTYAEMPGRYRSRPLPDVTVVDMREEPRWENAWFISRTLGSKLADRIERGEQSILFLNRRGHSTVLQCTLCGWSARCGDCDVAMTFHRSWDVLVCHYCNARRLLPDLCPSCDGVGLRLRGLGTEQVEEELRNGFPAIRIARMDLDSTARRGAHRRILERLRNGEADVLLGTQMVTKGLDFPGITLVGVISSDASLHIPDPRSAERTFDLLAQVAGRSGREGGGGEVVFQTFMPENDVLKAAQRLDYHGFAARELRERETAGYPPFFSLTDVAVAGVKRERVIGAVTRTAEWLRSRLEREFETGAGAVVGPAPKVVERVRGEYRWHLLLKTREGLDPARHLRALLASVKELSARDLRVAIDRDPVSFF